MPAPIAVVELTVCSLCRMFIMAVMSCQAPYTHMSNPRTNLFFTSLHGNMGSHTMVLEDNCLSHMINQRIGRFADVLADVCDNLTPSSFIFFSSRTRRLEDVSIGIRNGLSLQSCTVQELLVRNNGNDEDICTTQKSRSFYKALGSFIERKGNANPFHSLYSLKS